MKGRNLFWKLVVISSLNLVAYSCGSKVERFGDAPAESATKIAIGALLSDPQSYIDKDVVVEGTISSECPSGGWINVKDNSGNTIYVEMHSAPFAPIPQRVGRSVIVKGTVYQTGDTVKETKLLGKGLIIK